MSERKKLPMIVTPAAECNFPKLTEPDTKFKAEGVYSIQLLLDPSDEAHAKFLAQLKSLQKEAIAEATAENKAAKKKAPKVADTPWSAHTDKEGEETGLIKLNIKRTASGTTKAGRPWEAKVDVFDASGKPLPPKVAVWGGSIVKVAFQAVPFNTAIGAGISLRLSAVQVIDLKTAGQRDAGGYGFGQEEGYTYSEEDQPFGAGDDGGKPSEEDF